MVLTRSQTESKKMSNVTIRKRPAQNRVGYTTGLMYDINFLIDIVVPAVMKVYDVSIKTCKESMRLNGDDNMPQVPLDVKHISCALEVLDRGCSVDDIYYELNKNGKIYLAHKRDYGIPYNINECKQFLEKVFAKANSGCPVFTEDFIIYWCSILQGCSILPLKNKK